ncbi:MAG: hypothetical protein VW541_05280, partial [Pelagibacteraceae bacterium]
MYIKRLALFSLFLIISFISTQISESAPLDKLKEKFKVQIQEYENFTVIKYNYFDSNRKKNWDVAAEIHFPQNVKGKLPLIITQHGSSRNGYKFKKEGGKSDEFSKNILKKGLENG